jgi:hypothetical protein
MIELSEDLIFAEGGRRFCFVHPDDAGKCIKILNARGNPQKRKKESVWYKRFRPLSWFDDNKRELISFQDLEKKGDSVWDHFPRYYGIHQTNRGDGIITDLIRDTDRAVSKTVRQYIKAFGKTPELLAALDEFYALFRDRLIVTRDILDHNLVVQVNDEKLTIYMIDGFGTSEMIPFSSWFKSVATRKVNRKIQRFKIRYQVQSDSM